MFTADTIKQPIFRMKSQRGQPAAFRRRATQQFGLCSSGIKSDQRARVGADVDHAVRAQNGRIRLALIGRVISAGKAVVKECHLVRIRRIAEQPKRIRAGAVRERPQDAVSAPHVAVLINDGVMRFAEFRGVADMGDHTALARVDVVAKEYLRYCAKPIDDPALAIQRDGLDIRRRARPCEERKLPGVDIIFYKATALCSELLVDIMEQRNTAIQRIAIQFQRAVKLGVKRLAHLLVAAGGDGFGLTVKFPQQLS